MIHLVVTKPGGKQIAVAVQRGNADIMILDSSRRRGRPWPRRRRAGIVPRRTATPRSRGRVRRSLGSTTGNGHQGTQDDDAQARVARITRMIGLLDPRATCLRHSSEADSDAETEVACEDTPSSLPSIIPETPPSAGSEVCNEEIMFVPSSVAPEAQGADARSRERSANAAREGGRGAVAAIAVLSMAEALEDVVEGTTVNTVNTVNSVREMEEVTDEVTVHSVREMGDGGSCSVEDCSVSVR